MIFGLRGILYPGAISEFRYLGLKIEFVEEK